jgi:DNA modification methylase
MQVGVRTAQFLGTNGMRAPGYLLLKASAFQMPLPDDSVDFVLATPPHLGVKRFGKAGFCTSDPGEYQQMLKDALAECARIVKRWGYVLLFTRRGKRKSSKIFDVLQKRLRGRRWVLDRIKSESFHVRYVDVKDFCWQALPVSFYRFLIQRYSPRGQYVAHVFSGSGNGGIAALQLSRTPILIDLHYHRQTQARLNQRLGSRFRSRSLATATGAQSKRV